MAPLKKTPQAEFDQFFDENYDMEGFISLEEIDPITSSSLLKESIIPELSKKPTETNSATVKKSNGKRKRKILLKDKLNQNQNPSQNYTSSSFEKVSDTSPWFHFFLHPRIQHILIEKKFFTPTSIQNDLLSGYIISIDSMTGLAAMDVRDILATAPTVSYFMPI